MQALDELSNQHTQSYTHYTLLLKHTLQIPLLFFPFSLFLQRSKRVIDFTYFLLWTLTQHKEKNTQKTEKREDPLYIFTMSMTLKRFNQISPSLLASWRSKHIRKRCGFQEWLEQHKRSLWLRERHFVRCPSHSGEWQYVPIHFCPSSHL